MDATREHLLGRILLERRTIGDEELRRFVAERDELIRRGTRATLGQLLVRDRRLDATALAAIASEVELRGRACFTCRRAYLVPAGGPAQCPACGGPALLPALAPAGAGSPPSDDYSPSGRFPIGPLTGSGKFSPPSGALGSGVVRGATGSHRGNFFPQAAPPAAAAPSSALTGSSRLAPSLVASPNHGVTPPNVGSTDPGSNGGSSTRQGTELKTLGPYDLLQELGRGGMGVVYKAKHRQTQQVVALKVLLSGEFASPKMLARFREEAATVQKLDHPNIVPIHEVGEIEGINYFTMKFVDGDLFQSLLKGRALSNKRGAEIVRDVARGAQHAHETGIVHRDLKPANVIVERDTGTPYIMDFGLAKDLDEDKGLSKTGVAIGTPYYMPPEQAQGKHREIDPRSDVYALGAILYEVLARKVPFNAESQTLLLRKIVEEEPIPPSQIRQGVAPDLETIALKALKKAKDDRYPNAEAFAKDIDRALSGKEIKAKRDPFWKPLVARLAKNPKVVAIVGTCLLLATIAIGYGVHAINEAARIRAEEETRRQKEEAERIKREAEEAARRRREEAEGFISKGHTKRLQARLAPSAASARTTLEDAIDLFGKALPLTDEGSETRIAALYERAVCRLAADRTAMGAALDDLKIAGASPFAPARAHLAAGVAALRREHDVPRARLELDAGRNAGTPADGAARRDEEAAALLCRAYLDAIDDRTSSAIKLAQDAATKSDDFALEAGAAELHARIATLAAAGQEAVDAARLANRLYAIDRWQHAVLCDRAYAHALVANNNALGIAHESVSAARDVDPASIDVKLIDGWIRTTIGQGEQYLANALGEARREYPAATEHWNALEKKLAAASESLRRAIGKERKPNEPQPPKQQPQQPRKQQPTGPRKGGSHVLWEDFSVTHPPEMKPRVQQVLDLQNADKKAEAAELLAKLAAESPESVGLQIWRARLLVETGRALDARPIIDLVLAKKPDDPFGLAVRGLCEGALGNVDPCRSAFDKCIAENPGLRTPRIVYSNLLIEQNEFPAAEAVAKPLYDADPNDWEAGYALARAWWQMDRPDDTIALSKKLIDARPKNVEVRMNLSAAYRSADKLDEALKLVDDSIKLIGENFWFLAERSIVLWFLKRYDESDRTADKARTLASDSEKEQLASVLEQVKGKFPREK